MGVAITDLLDRKEIEFSSLANKVIAIDAPLFLYQFLATIRSQDGTPLTDKKGRVTSHLSGLFFRTANLMQKKLKLVYVFDGKAPELKLKERERRSKLKDVAQEKYKEAVQKKDVAEMRKYAQRTSRLTGDMIAEAIELIEAFGIPVVKAASEAEAQASYMAKKGDVYGVGTQDSDTLMFGCPKLIRNLSIAGKRKRTNKLAFEVFKPEMVDYATTLKKLEISHDKLIAMCMLIGTDFNVGGVKGLGPKKALALVKKCDTIDAVFEEAKWEDFFEVSWKEVFDLIKNIPVTDDYDLKWNSINYDKLREILVHNHDFMEERIENTLKKLEKEVEKSQQKGLSDFF